MGGWFVGWCVFFGSRLPLAEAERIAREIESGQPVASKCSETSGPKKGPEIVDLFDLLRQKE